MQAAALQRAGAPLAQPVPLAQPCGRRPAAGRRSSWPQPVRAAASAEEPSEQGELPGAKLVKSMLALGAAGLVSAVGVETVGAAAAAAAGALSPCALAPRPALGWSPCTAASPAVAALPQMGPRVAPLAAEALSAAESSAVVLGGTAAASALASAAATLGITKRAEKEQQVGALRAAHAWLPNASMRGRRGCWGCLQRGALPPAPPALPGSHPSPTLPAPPAQLPNRRGSGRGWTSSRRRWSSCRSCSSRSWRCCRCR